MKKLVLSSRNKDFTEDSFQFKFTLNNTITIKEKVVLERFFFQNIQPQFSEALRINKFIIETLDEGAGTIAQNIVILEGYYPSVNDLVSKMNQLLIPINIQITYSASLWEFTLTYIGTNPNIKFKLLEYNKDYEALALFGFSPSETYEKVQRSTKTPRLYAKTILYIKIDELGTYQNFVKSQRPFTFCILAQNGQEIHFTSQNDYDNTFYLNGLEREINTITISLLNADGLPIKPMKLDGNMTCVLSYQ